MSDDEDKMVTGDDATSEPGGDPGGEPSGDQPLLTVAMMVKDEEGFLEDALVSAQPWADEIVVVDTGSTDRTVEIARRHGAKVSHFQWCDSFAAARNTTLERSTGRWILVLDADERLEGEDPARLRRQLEGMNVDHPFEVLTLEVVNTTLAGDVLSTLDSVRIIPNDRRLGYSARVHHVFGSLDPKFPEINSQPFDGLKILHLGYDPEVYRTRQKAERSLPLIEQQVREEPENLLYVFYLGREYFALQRHEEAIRVLEAGVERMKATKGVDRDLWFDTRWHLVAALEHAGRPPLEVLAAAKAGLEDFPTSPDLWFLAAGALAAAGHLDEALKCLQRTLTSMEGAEQLAVRHLTGAWQVYHRVGDLLADAGNMADAYRAYLTAIAERPVTRPQWPVLLNVAIGLGIDLKDHDRVPGLIDDLLDCPTAPLDLFAVWLGRVEAADGIDAARARLAEATKRTPRLDGAEGFEQWR